MADGELLLDGPAAAAWQLLSEQVQTARHHRVASTMNETLLTHATREPQSPLAGPVRLWAADSLASEARFEQAEALYQEVVDRHAGEALGGVDLESASLCRMADCQERFDTPDAALATYQRLAELGTERFSPAWALYQMGRVAEWHDLAEEAGRAYAAAADAPDQPVRNHFPMPDLAARAAKRMQASRPGVRPQPDDVAAELAAALRNGDLGRLRELASPTHFTLGIGGHLEFIEPEDLLPSIEADLGVSEVRLDHAALTGHGAKRYLETDGWQGQWLSGQVIMLITRSHDGWEWTGVALTLLTDPWAERVDPGNKAPNQIVTLPLKAPWPAGIRMRAGGLRNYILEQASIAVAAAFWPAGPFLALAATVALAARDCGFGPGVLYHDMWPTHLNQQDRFAVDFIRYQQFVPYHNIAGQTPVLAAAAGMVTMADHSVPSGDSGRDNRVEITHHGFASIGRGLLVLLGGRWRSKYLHLQAASTQPVSAGMFVRQGARLGVMDDTGNSAFDHLHFSMHDANNGDRAAKATPLDGQRLDTGDDARCVLSTNTPFP
ncbi:MAG: peptidoglycan DD-metalloendopeptidase family protein [Acidimicrobiia bacterium]|nr:peptidoglycan DD-metalloendopeptidase family protein [Acidimicrobiia bacterium]